MTIFYITNCDGLWGCHMMNERLQPEDSKGELIHSLSGSYCIGLTYGLSRDERTTQTQRHVR